MIDDFTLIVLWAWSSLINSISIITMRVLRVICFDFSHTISDQWGCVKWVTIKRTSLIYRAMIGFLILIIILALYLHLILRENWGKILSLVSSEMNRNLLLFCRALVYLHLSGFLQILSGICEWLKVPIWSAQHSVLVIRNLVVDILVRWGRWTGEITQLRLAYTEWWCISINRVSWRLVSILERTLRHL